MGSNSKSNLFYEIPTKTSQIYQICRWVFGFRIKDCSADEAIKKAGIKQVQTINYDFFHSGFYNSQTISVRGK